MDRPYKFMFYIRLERNYKRSFISLRGDYESAIDIHTYTLTYRR